MIAIGPTHRDLLTHLHIKMQKIGDATTALDAKFHILFICRRGGNRENRLALAGYGQDGALAGHMLEQLSTV